MPAGPNVLRSKRLILRETVRADLIDLAAGRVSPGQEAVLGYPLDGTRDAAAMALLDHEKGQYQCGFGMYQITERASGLIVGDIGFHGRPDQGVAEVGYGIAPSRRGQGLVSEALRSLVRWALAQPDVHRVEAGTDAHNVASQRVLLAAGFVGVDLSGPQLRFVYQPS
ncbi:MAG: GNAT family N-acetyltransferase [Candidatus Nanopelagicales bacterium]